MKVMRGWGWKKRWGRTEEETFPDFEEVGGGEGAAGAEVGLKGGEGLFAGWSVCEVGKVSDVL